MSTAGHSAGDKIGRQLIEDVLQGAIPGPALHVTQIQCNRLLDEIRTIDRGVSFILFYQHVGEDIKSMLLRRCLVGHGAMIHPLG